MIDFNDWDEPFWPKQEAQEPPVEIHRRYRRNEILLQKDAPDKDWYIIVTGKDGCYRYDGYWRDSETKDWQAALKEAKRGAEI
jgi:hypothetical protein